MFSFGTLFFKICTERFIPMADIFCRIVKGIAEVSGTTFLHTGMTVIQLTGLVCGWRHPSIGQYFICWSLVTNTFEELDIKPAIDDLLKMLEGKLQIIKKICEENNGEVCFEIVSIFERDNLPAIYFEKRFLSIVNYLDAVIDIDMYLN